MVCEFVLSRPSSGQHHLWRQNATSCFPHFSVFINKLSMLSKVSLGQIFERILEPILWVVCQISKIFLYGFLMPCLVNCRGNSGNNLTTSVWLLCKSTINYRQFGSLQYARPNGLRIKIQKKITVVQVVSPCVQITNFAVVWTRFVHIKAMASLFTKLTAFRIGLKYW